MKSALTFWRSRYFSVCEHGGFVEHATLIFLTYIHSFPIPLATPYTVWLLSVKRFQRRRYLIDQCQNIKSPCEPYIRVSQKIVNEVLSLTVHPPPSVVRSQYDVTGQDEVPQGYNVYTPELVEPKSNTSLQFPANPGRE